MYLLVIAHRQIDTINTNGGGGAATAVAASSAVESATSTATEVTAVTVAAAAAIASGIQHDAWRQRQHAAAILCSRLLKFTGTRGTDPTDERWMDGGQMSHGRFMTRHDTP